MKPKSSRIRWCSALFSAVATLSALLVSTPLAAQQREWQSLQIPTVKLAGERFGNPPAEYGLVLWWFWNGELTDAEIIRDLEEMKSHGARSLMVFPYFGMTIEYLSPAYFERVKFAVGAAKRAGLRIWFMDEGSYPSSFVGGRITRERPDLRMKALAIGEKFTAIAGQKVSLRRDQNTVAVYAVEQGGERILLEGDEWTPAKGKWDIRSVRWEYRTPATRHANRAGFFKDSMFSLSDPLDPEATKFFLDAVHEEYRKHIGDEFGKTVMGFMGDEPSVAGLPWTPRFLEEFRARKKYDLKPYLASLLDDRGEVPSNIRADYFDVWTDLYNENFFRPQAEWCERNGLEYIVHLCGEEETPVFIRLNGDYFKANRHVQIPGVDAIWRQIWYDKTEYYPKLASSSAHLRGRPRAFTESFAVYGAGLSLAQAKWVFDYQAVRGINHFQAMEYLSSAAGFRLYFHPPHWGASPLWPYFREFADYFSRLTYLLSVGRPAAKLAVYFPTTSGWANDWRPDESVREIAKLLSEHQRDFDFVDEDGLKSDLEVAGPALRNRSGQKYTGLILPPVRFLSAQAMDKVAQFAKAGGKVIFAGGPPHQIVGTTYRDGQPGKNHPLFAGGASSVMSIDHLNASILGELPNSDVKLSPAAPDIKYLRRTLQDGEVYFFFNEGARRIEVQAGLEGSGSPELWDARTGDRVGIPGTRSTGMVNIPLVLEPYATAVVVLRPAADVREAQPPQRFQTRSVIQGDWEVTVDGKTVTAGLQSWSNMGKAGYWGTGTYRKQFTVDGSLGKEGLWLDLGEVRYAARVRLNGRDLGTRAWGPFRWDIRSAVRPGNNVLEVEVANTGANELAGDPDRFREIERKGLLTNSYIKMYLKFDQEMISSGLIGPVVLSTAEPVR